MSKENHPNFHAVKFITDITLSIIESVRAENISNEEKGKILLLLNDKVINFVAEIEETSVVD